MKIYTRKISKNIRTYRLNQPRGHYSEAQNCQIVPFGKFHRTGGAPPETFPNVKYNAPEEVGGDRKCFDSPIRDLSKGEADLPF